MPTKKEHEVILPTPPHRAKAAHGYSYGSGSDGVANGKRSTKWGARRAFHGAISSSEALKYYWYEIAMEEYYANKY